MPSPLTIREGTEYILSHCHGDNALWPRWSAVKGYWPCKDRKRTDKRDQADYSIKDTLYRFYSANLEDCRLSPYPDFVESYMKSDVREARAYQSAGIVPEVIMIDIDE